MSNRAALITGASGGIGLAIARMLGEEGHSLTVVARRADKLEQAAETLRAEGFEVEAIAANLGNEDEIVSSVTQHRAKYGRLDVLVNNAGVGIGSPVEEITTKAIDMQLGVNFRATILYYRECTAMLRKAAEEHRNALVINTSSIAGKRGQGWLSVYSATKSAIVGFTEAMNNELNSAGIKSTALCPAFVDTAMTDFVKGEVAPEEMIRPEDVAEMTRPLLKLSPACIVPEIMMVRPGNGL